MNKEDTVASGPILDEHGEPYPTLTPPATSGLAQTEVAPEQFVEDRLRAGDKYVRDCLASMITGLQLVNYGMSRLAAPLRAFYKEDTVKMDAAMETAVKFSRQIAEQPYNQLSLLGAFDQLGQMLTAHAAEERKHREEQKAEQMEGEGLEFPLKTASALQLGGSLKAGMVVVLRGDEAVYDLMGALVKLYNRRNVPATHYSKAKQSQLRNNIPGLRQVGGEVWLGATRTAENCKKVFDGTVMGYVLYVDDLDSLFPTGHQSPKERRSDSIKRLLKVAKRHKVAILVGGFGLDEEVRYHPGSYEIRVSRAKINEQDGWMLGDEFFPKKENSSELDFGDRDGAGQV
jgi:hypothetical protein